MVKNVLIGLLSISLLGVGFVIVRDTVSEKEARDISAESTQIENETNSKKKEEPEEAQEESRVDIVGSWRSTDDSQSVITFLANGEVVDTYGGGVLMETGTYQVFDDGESLPSELSTASDGPFLRQTFNSEEYYYEIIKLTEGVLELIVISGRGNILRYERL